VRCASSSRKKVRRGKTGARRRNWYTQHFFSTLNDGALSIFLIRKDHRFYVVLVGRVFAHALGAFVVWHLSLPSMELQLQYK